MSLLSLSLSPALSLLLRAHREHLPSLSRHRCRSLVPLAGCLPSGTGRPSRGGGATERSAFRSHTAHLLAARFSGRPTADVHGARNFLARSGVLAERTPKQPVFACSRFRQRACVVRVLLAFHQRRLVSRQHICTFFTELVRVSRGSLSRNFLLVDRRRSRGSLDERRCDETRESAT